MRLMLNALLDYSKCDGSSVRGKTANIARVIDDTLEHIDFGAEGADVRINLGGVSHVYGDHLLLGHVIQNLVGNAIKFRGPDRPTIEITAARTGATVTFAVTDNGIGIEPEYAESVFEMFCRLHDEDEYEGSGIGLTVCRKIVNDHGGRIWVDTGHVGGTKILFTLASADAGEGPADQPASVGLAA
jgi:light-regulated signal transduction histidine kinase (bacteriophytochrome)